MSSGSQGRSLTRGLAGSVLLDRPDGEPLDPAAAADFALGASLRSYAFDKYGPTRGGNGTRKPPPEIAILVDDPAKAKAAWARAQAIATGVVMARDLIHEGSGRWPIGNDEVFLLGDNSADSQDSRSFGPVPKSRLRGKVLGVAWPPSRARLID